MVERIEGGVTAARGFAASGLHCGIKRKRKDLALIVSERPAAAAAALTNNVVQAAPIHITREHVARGSLRAIVCNSGNANACTGEQGLADARRMAELTAAAIGVQAREVAVASTGVIGEPLPMGNIEAGIAAVARRLSPDGGDDAAAAILTTDTAVKQVAVEFELKGKRVRMGGIAKGSGMIEPNMATMLAFVTTDAHIEPLLLRELVAASVARTYNRITVDGDTSTNDAVIVMANGCADNPRLERGDADAKTFARALDYVNEQLAKAIVRDGEGATTFVEIVVRGASTEADALQVARSIARSSLVKTAVYGRDANWGRILAAAGYAGVPFDADKVDVYIGDVMVASEGRGAPFDEAAASRALKQPSVRLTVDLHGGDAEATVWTCDLTDEYVKINASYRT